MLLEIKNLHFSYEADRPIFNNLNLSIEQGEIVAIAGESGCGKSTLLSLIYGLYDWQKGDILLNGKKLLGPKGNLVPGEKEMKFVAQHYDLIPYASVAENVGLYLSNVNLKAKKDKILELLDIVDMQDFTHEKPRFLSGGQQQRVAIARALSVPQKLILLDEPFSNLDYSRKVTIREKIFNYAKKNNISIIVSTHEIQEITPWIDRLIIMKNGKTLQNDSPKNIYENPNNEYVAQLFGEVNIFNDAEQKQFGLTKKFYYPTDFEVNPDGEDFEVIESRFSGGFYRNKINFYGKTIVTYSPKKLNNYTNIKY